MKKHIFYIAILLIFVASDIWANDWKNSPHNWKNSENNWNNNPSNWKNSPYNWKNSEYNPNRKNAVYDEDGNPVGYTTRKDGGGVNIYDNTGKRRGYSAGDE